MGQALSLIDIHAARIAYLTDSDSTILSLATAYGVAPGTMSGYLSGPEFDKLRDQLQADMTRNARDILHRAAESAAGHWAKAIPIAAARGDHKPARDLLAAVDAISLSSKDKMPSVTVQIGLSLADLQLPKTIP